MRIALLLPLLAVACADAEQAPVPILSFRFECAPDTPGSIEQELEQGFSSRFGPLEVFELAYSGPTIDANGRPAVAFQIRGDHAARFSDLTEQYTGKRLAIYVDGKFLSAPQINERLPGGGIITGGTQGFTIEAIKSLVERLNTQIQPL